MILTDWERYNMVYKKTNIEQCFEVNLAQKKKQKQKKEISKLKY